MKNYKDRIKVLIVDDSAIVRKMLTAELSRYANIEIVGTAPDAFIARNKIVALKPDVLTLDLEMPRMNGITFLQKLMKQHPMPVIVLSSFTPRGSKKAMEAYDAGAIEVICKPEPADNIRDICKTLVEKIQAASKAHMDRRPLKAEQITSPMKPLAIAEATNTIFAIGASTGGVQALTTILSALPANAPGTLVVQHMLPRFTASFAERLDIVCAMKVKEAQDKDVLTAGEALVAPGGRHMLLQRHSNDYYVTIKDGPEVCRQKPSVEVLFNSVAKYAGPNAVGVILTGMANDGAKGLLNMRKHNAHTIAQDESSSIVFGMPREAIKLGAAEKVVSLPNIAATMIQFIKVGKSCEAVGTEKYKIA